MYDFVSNLGQSDWWKLTTLYDGPSGYVAANVVVDGWYESLVHPSSVGTNWNGASLTQSLLPFIAAAVPLGALTHILTGQVC